MRPLSNKKRNIIFALFLGAFAVLFPIILLYSTGYRLSDHFSLVRTGGIYIHPWNVRGTVSVNGEALGQTALIGRDYLVQSLKSGKYEVSLTRDGYFDWKKTITVKRQLVTEVSPFIVPKDPIITEIPKFIEPEIAPVAGSKKKAPVQNPLWKTISILFTPVDIVKKPAVTETAVTEKEQADNIATPESKGEKHYQEFRKMAVWEKDGAIFAQWLGDKEYTPPYFCDSDIVCRPTLRVLPNAGILADFMFYPDRNDILIASFPDGIYAVELDTRDIQNKMLIFPGKSLSLRLDGNTLYIQKDPATFVQITLE